MAAEKAAAEKAAAEAKAKAAAEKAAAEKAKKDAAERAKRAEEARKLAEAQAFQRSVTETIQKIVGVGVLGGGAALFLKSQEDAPRARGSAPTAPPSAPPPLKTSDGAADKSAADAAYDRFVQQKEKQQAATRGAMEDEDAYLQRLQERAKKLMAEAEELRKLEESQQ